MMQCPNCRAEDIVKNGRIHMAGLARVTSVSERWWQNYVNKKYAEIPQQVAILPKKKSD